MDENGFSKLDWIIYSVIAVILIFICILFGGCKTTNSATGNTGYTNAYIIGQLTQSVDEFDRGIGAAVEKSRSITDAIDRIDNLFTEYERAALKLRDEVDTLRKQIQDEDKSDNSGIINNSATHNNIYSVDGSNEQGN